jgi:hypothetical protein
MRNLSSTKKISKLELSARPNSTENFTEQCQPSLAYSGNNHFLIVAWTSLFKLSAISASDFPSMFKNTILWRKEADKRAATLLEA